MVSLSDPIESIHNSIQAVKDSLLPLELGVRKVAKDLETHWTVHKHKENNLESVTDLRNGDRNSKVQVSGAKKKSLKAGNDVECMVSDERNKGVSLRVPVKTLSGLFSLDVRDEDCKSNLPNKASKKKGLDKDDGSCVNCLQFAMPWSFLVNDFLQTLHRPFKIGKKRVQKVGDREKEVVHSRKQGSEPKIVYGVKQRKSRSRSVSVSKSEEAANKVGKQLSLECLLSFLFDQVTQNLQKLDNVVNGAANKDGLTSPLDHLKAVNSVWEARIVNLNGFLGNLQFARVGSLPSSVAGISANEGGDDVTPESREETGVSVPQKLASGILSIPISNVERLKSTLSTVSLTELVELLPQLGRPSTDYPDKKKLFSVQDFFRYTELEGKRFFEELDRDGDGQVNLEDLEIAMRKRKLPRRYAREFMHRARSHIFSKSFGWRQFLSVMEQKEATILRAYTSLCLSKSGTLQKSEILTSLKNAGLPADDENAVAMMRYLNADDEGSISYGHFRNFMLLLPSERLQDDPRSVWFEAATVVPVAPPMELPAGNVLRSALAGGLASALSTSLLHPIDSIKTRVQASTLSFPEIISKLPQIGARGLYRGSIPAILGQFSSHGLRTGTMEATRLVLVNVAPNLPDFQVQSIASFCSTILGTAVRIPCEVLKQRLQAGIFDNVGEAIIGTWHQDGLKGFFRGTGATLCREVPFYVAGMGLYGESKKLAQQILGRELEPWETIAVGALSGGLAAVVTTPFDVMKTRMMTAPQGRSVSMSIIALSVLRHEGPLGLFKGAVPRFFWIAPLGAMNFAGYELARKAMEKNEDLAGDQFSQKKLANAG